MTHVIQTIVTPGDYEWSSVVNAYVMPHRAFAPGNPAQDPETGADEFNQWLTMQSYPAHSPLDDVIVAAKQPGETGKRTASLLLELLRAKDPEEHARAIDGHELTDFACGSALLFCHDEITELKAADRLSLRNELMLRCSDRA